MIIGFQWGGKCRLMQGCEKQKIREPSSLCRTRRSLFTRSNKGPPGTFLLTNFPFRSPQGRLIYKHITGSRPSGRKLKMPRINSIVVLSLIEMIFFIVNMWFRVLCLCRKHHAQFILIRLPLQFVRRILINFKSFQSWGSRELGVATAAKTRH